MGRTATAFDIKQAHDVWGRIDRPVDGTSAVRARARASSVANRLEGADAELAAMRRGLMKLIEGQRGLTRELNIGGALYVGGRIPAIIEGMEQQLEGAVSCLAAAREAAREAARHARDGAWTLAHRAPVAAGGRPSKRSAFVRQLLRVDPFAPLATLEHWRSLHDQIPFFGKKFEAKRMTQLLKQCGHKPPS